MLRFILMKTLIISGLFLVSCSGKSLIRTTKIPPGTIYFKFLGYYVDKHEVTVLSWREFYYYVRNSEGEEHALAYLPDTNVLIAYYGENVFSNIRNTRARELPIIGLTSRQIEAFCRFRSDRVNEKYGNNVKYSLFDIESYTFLKNKYKNKTETNISNELVPVREAQVFKGIFGLFNNAPELITYQSEYRIIINSDSLVQHEGFKPAFGFRCIAKYH